MRTTGLWRCRLTAALAILLPAAATGHGGVVEEDDLCVINIGYLKAHFKIYVPQQTAHEDYCEDIPVRGESIFVMEYLHDGLDDAEIEFRIIENVTGKGTFARYSDIEAIADLDEVTVRWAEASIVPAVYTLLHAFEADGEYIGIVSARPAASETVYHAVFPFEVGYTGLGVWPWIVAAVVLLQLNFWWLRYRARTAATVAAVAAVLLALPAQAADTWSSDARHFQVSYTSDVAPIEINRMHGWTLTVLRADGSPVDGARIAVSGGMPSHNHGLPTAPRVTRELGDGRYRIDGLRFHMRGEWALRLVIDDGSVRDSVTIPLTL